MKLPHAPSGDPLLTATTLLLYLVIAFLMIAGAALAIALPGVPLGWSHITAEIAKEYPGVALNRLMPAILACIALGLAMVILAFQFVRKLLQIIRTVGEGDPFDTANGKRLEQMGWITLAIQIVGLVMGSLVFWISKQLGEHDVHFEMGFESIITMFLLFVLARVFRRGAEMRKDLEGTV